MDCLIRKAMIDDIEELRKLYLALEEDGVRYQPEHFVIGERTEDFFQSVFKSDNQDFLVADIGGKTIGFVHVIDIMAGYQNLGYGTELIRFVHAHSKSLGCRKMFLMTNTRNVSACRCYEKAGGISVVDVVMYEYKK